MMITISQNQFSVRKSSFLMLEKLRKPFSQKILHKFTLLFRRKKSNNFDGIIGFGNNDKKKFSFTGSINLQSKNVFNSFETISLYWQRNQQTDKTSIYKPIFRIFLVLTSARISI